MKDPAVIEERYRQMRALGVIDDSQLQEGLESAQRLRDGLCPLCGTTVDLAPATPTEHREYAISGMCPPCQRRAFGMDEGAV